jgi:thiamine biosynthesis lipoprotein
MSAPVRRAQALLGTLVDIEARALADVAEPALAASFRRVAEVHAAMSFHEAGSDLRRIARAAAGAVLRIAPDTHAVLALAMQLEADSKGAFNACRAADTLIERGLLPRPEEAPANAAASLAEGIELLGDSRLRVLRPAWIDLGGIAKGHAVDVAVDALQEAGVEAGVVNAGGDLRCFGARPLTVQIRDPRRPGLALPLAEINDLACATSAWLLAQPERRAAHLAGTAEGVEDNPLMSVTVFAPRCAMADALTKVVWLRGGDAAPLLRTHGAQALVWREHGDPHPL